MSKTLTKENSLEKEVVLTIRVPKNFDDDMEQHIDETLADTLASLGYQLLNSKSYQDITREEDSIPSSPVISQEKREENHSRLASLQEYSKNEETLKLAAQQKEDQRRALLISKICALAPRIDELISIGNACLENNIPLTGHAYGMHEGYDTHQFFTNSWSHLVGFVGNPHSQPCHIQYLGINGGGACGVYNFRTDGRDVFSVHENNPYDISKPSIVHMENFLHRFDSFESSFYGYVDSVLEHQRKSVDKLISSAQERTYLHGVEGPKNMNSPKIDSFPER